MALQDTLAAYFKFDQTSGNITDSVRGIVGTNTNTVTFGSGKINNCATFGETAYFDCTNNAALQLSIFTFACWVNTTDTTNNKTLAIGNSAAGSGFQWRIDTTLKQQFNKQGVAGIATSTTAVPAGWNHVALTYNNSSGVATFYLNGIADGGATSAQTFTQGNFFIGYNNASEGMIGSIDEMAIFSSVLTAQDIQVLYNGGLGNQYPFGSSHPVHLRPAPFRPGFAR